MSWTTRTFDCRDGQLALHVRPPLAAAREGGLPLVLLHGFTGSGRDWSDVAAALPDRHVLAPDLPGHGNTRLDGIAFADVAALLVAALEDSGIDRFDLGGYSMGGRLALHLAVARPDLVAHLILESASPGIADEAERALRREADEALATLALECGMEAFVDRWEQTPVLAAERRLPDAERAALRDRRLRCRSAGLAASLRHMGTGAQPWLGDRLHTLKVPTLLLAGGDDPKFCAIAAAMNEQLPHGRVEIAAGAGHNIHLERPEWFAARVAAFIAAERTDGSDTLATTAGKEARA
jgi:2-succinyl-6-hydroxy-2,4-cyclohexadiene-1-carboxylate synthase